VRKIVYVALHGVGDRPIAALQGRTPLYAAATPNLVHEAEPPSTGRAVAVMAILGYDPRTYRAGRSGSGCANRRSARAAQKWARG